MAHHSDKQWIYNEQWQKMLEENENRINKLRLGSTGLFPEGKLNEDDEGEIAIAIMIINNKIIIDFGKQIHWIGFTKEQAEQIGYSLIKKASKLGGK